MSDRDWTKQDEAEFRTDLLMAMTETGEDAHLDPEVASE